MKDKGPNDLEKKIYVLERGNFKLNEENNMLKKEIAFLREEIQADNLTKIIVKEIFIPYIGISKPAVFVNLNSKCENVLLLQLK
jgi:hypothetical protein